MTTYAPIPSFAERSRHPRALTLIVAGHAALIAAVITAKMDLPVKPWDPPIVIDPIPIPPDPPPTPADPTKQQPTNRPIDRTPPVVPIRPQTGSEASPTPAPGPGPFTGPIVEPQPLPQPITLPVRTGPRFITRPEDLKPPYPIEKRRLEEEAVLKLRLSIDERGKVTAVEPIGRADPVFLAAARRHLLARWRYKPATEDWRAVAASTVITLRFELDEE